MLRTGAALDQRERLGYRSCSESTGTSQLTAMSKIEPVATHIQRLLALPLGLLTLLLSRLAGGRGGLTRTRRDWGSGLDFIYAQS